MVCTWQGIFNFFRGLFHFKDCLKYCLFFVSSGGIFYLLYLQLTDPRLSSSIFPISMFVIDH